MKDLIEPWLHFISLRPRGYFAHGIHAFVYTYALYVTYVCINIYLRVNIKFIVELVLYIIYCQIHSRIGTLFQFVFHYTEKLCGLEFTTIRTSPSTNHTLKYISQKCIFLISFRIKLNIFRYFGSVLHDLTVF